MSPVPTSTVRGFERAGAALIQIEDQGFPKRCGHLDGKTVIRDVVRGRSAEAQTLGTQLAERLLSRGADMILREIYGRA